MVMKTTKMMCPVSAHHFSFLCEFAHFRFLVVVTALKNKTLSHTHTHTLQQP